MAMENNNNNNNNKKARIHVSHSRETIFLVADDCSPTKISSS